jgi:hypothetical protein
LTIANTSSDDRDCLTFLRAAISFENGETSKFAPSLFSPLSITVDILSSPLPPRNVNLNQTLSQKSAPLCRPPMLPKCGCRPHSAWSSSIRYQSTAARLISAHSRSTSPTRLARRTPWKGDRPPRGALSRPNEFRIDGRRLTKNSARARPVSSESPPPSAPFLNAARGLPCRRCHTGAICNYSFIAFRGRCRHLLLFLEAAHSASNAIGTTVFFSTVVAQPRCAHSFARVR